MEVGQGPNWGCSAKEKKIKQKAVATQSNTGDEKEPGAWGYNWATLSLGGYKYRDLVLHVGCWTQG
jgi:hypothetical protein